MKIHSSTIQPLNKVTFPEFMGERIYMREITKGKLPSDLSRWQETVDQMFKHIEVPTVAYLMVDQKEVLANTLHRRGGVHVDGYWQAGETTHGGHKSNATIKCHGGNVHSSNGDTPAKPTHGSTPSHRSTPTPSHSPIPSHNGGGRWQSDRNEPRIAPPLVPIRVPIPSPLDSWLNADFSQPETLLLASNITACRAWEGEYQGIIKAGGDCSDIEVDHLKQLLLEPHKVYAATVGTLHESLPIPFACQRTLVRINVPNGIVTI